MKNRFDGAQTRWLIGASLAALASLAQAGAVMETQTRDLQGKDGPTTTIKTYAQAESLRVETSSNEGVMLFKDDALYYIQPKDKTYTVMDRASMKRMAEQINPALKQLQEQLAKMPPEQRAQVEKMMGGQSLGGPAKPKSQQVRKTGRSGKVGGYACNYVEIIEDGVVTTEACVAAPNALQGADELMSAAKRMSALLADMMNNIDAPWMQQMVDNQTANFEKLGGIPVLMRRLSDGAPVHEMQLKSVRTESLPASLFATPAGYTRKDMMGAR